MIGGILYAAGWIFFALFYAEFDVTPESAGMTFGFIVVRVGILFAAALAVIVALCFLFPNAAGEFVESNLRLRNTAFLLLWVLVTLLILFTAILVVSSFQPWKAVPFPWSIAAAAGVGLIALAGVVGIAGLLLHFSKYKGLSREVVISGRKVVVSVVVVTCGLLLGALVACAPLLASYVKRGNQFSVFGFRVDRVSVTWADANLGKALGAANGSCGTLLGRSDGDFILYFKKTDQTMTVNTQLLVVQRRPDEGC